MVGLGHRDGEPHMYITVNKKTSNRRPVKYSALSNALNAATSSGVWMDEETSAQSAQKRTNRIKLTRAAKKSDYDA